MTSLKNQLKQLNQEAGVTLVELLAAIAILSIIVTAFLAFFVQAGRTNNMTDKVNEATFLAQEEMENVMKYNQISNVTLDSYNDLAEQTQSDGYKLSTVIEKKHINDEGPKLYNVIVTVKSLEDDTLAQMETWLPLKEADD